MTLEQKKTAAQTWFRCLRDDICARFEALEATYAQTATDVARSGDGRREPPREGGKEPLGDEGGGLPPFMPERQRHHFTITPWSRPEGGGGEIGLMKGRVFEKVGVNISTVSGEFSEQFRREIPGAAADPRFWATGISLVAHTANPHAPAAHFNTRMIVVGEGARLWFGGGGDLNPMIAPVADDTARFHAAMQRACDAYDPTFYQAFSAWCDEYFFLPHRNVARGVGGIFYDYLGLNRLGTTQDCIAPGQFGKGGLGKERTEAGMKLASDAAMDWDSAFAFTQEVGKQFAEIYPTLVGERMAQPYGETERAQQLRSRGRYAEYNLLYDRGTRFGLMTGGNPEAILMSLPPLAVWD